MFVKKIDYKFYRKLTIGYRKLFISHLNTIQDYCTNSKTLDLIKENIYMLKNIGDKRVLVISARLIYEKNS